MITYWIFYSNISDLMITYKSHYHNQTGACPVCEEERDDCGKCGVPGSQQWNSKIYS